MMSPYPTACALIPQSTRDAAPLTPEHPDTVVVAWNAAALQAVRDTHPGPPMVARQLAVLHACMYDAWSAYDDAAVGTRVGGYLRRPAAERTDENKLRAVSVAAYRALADLFPLPPQVAAFGAVMATLGLNPADQSTDITTPVGIGNLAARAVLAFRHGDGSNQLGDLHPGFYSDYTGYAPVNTPDAINDPARWQPLRVSDGQGGTMDQHYIAPHWGLVTPFALTDAVFDGIQPPAVPSPWIPTFTKQAQEVLDYSANLTDVQKVIAEYWADGPASELPPGHWCLFAQSVSHRDGHSLDQDVRMFFALTAAILDASIACWGAKRQFDSVRPVTAIHFLFGGTQVLAWAGPGRGVLMIDGAAWQPYQALTVVTPPFAEYFSGHSTFSAAGAEVLMRFTGSDAFGESATVRAGTSRVEPGQVPAADVTLAWPTFSAAADEAGISRRYGGIHFIIGDLVGRTVGRRVGALAWAKAQSYFDGSARVV